MFSLLNKSFLWPPDPPFPPVTPSLLTHALMPAVTQHSYGGRKRWLGAHTPYVGNFARQLNLSLSQFSGFVKWE